MYTEAAPSSGPQSNSAPTRRQQQLCGADPEVLEGLITSLWSARAFPLLCQYHIVRWCRRFCDRKYKILDTCMERSLSIMRQRRRSQPQRRTVQIEGIPPRYEAHATQKVGGDSFKYLLVFRRCWLTVIIGSHPIFAGIAILLWYLYRLVLTGPFFSHLQARRNQLR